MAKPLHQRKDLEPSGPRALTLDELLEHNLAKLQAFVRCRIGNLGRTESVADIVQSTCREVLAHPEWFQTEDEERFRKWVQITANRKMLNRVAHWKTQKRGAGKTGSLDDAAGEESAAAQPASPDPTPSQVEIGKEVERRFREALRRLPGNYAEVVILSRFEGLSRKEIAARLGRSEDSVRNLLARALVRLAEELS